MEVTLPAEPSCQPSGIYLSFPATVLMVCAQIPPPFSSFIAIERVSEFFHPVCTLLLCSSCGLASLTWCCHSLMRCSPRSPSPPFLVYILGNRFGGKEGAWSLGETMAEFSFPKRKIFSPKEKCLLEHNLIPICLTLKMWPQSRLQANV